MLWLKEKDSDLYVDLIENLNYPLRLWRLKREKSNADAVDARIIGNQKFKSGDFHGAMAEYNKSICLAENGSEYLGIAYANRSACFDKMNMFRFCLADIRMAEDNNYPLRLVHKLDERKRNCMLKIQHKQSDPSLPSLSFPSDENLPCMANVLRIDTNDEFGRLITATQDIQIGDTILLEESYVHLAVGENINKCTNCGKKNVNFFPCHKCSDAMFCSELCFKNNFHSIECELLFDSEIFKCEHFFPVYILRSLVIGISTFSSTSEMMMFVERCRTASKYEIPHSTSTAMSKYGTFFKLSSYVPDQLSQLFLDHRRMTYSVYHSIISSSLGVQFQTKAHQRFLVHLIMHHSFILRTNSFGGFDAPEVNFGEPMSSAKNGDAYEQCLNLVSSYFNHSCCPNVALFSKNNLSIFKAILPIRKGEQLFISYIDEDNDEYKTVADRQILLQDSFGFICKCSICERGILKGTFALQDDISYINVVKGVGELGKNFNLLIVAEIIENCKRFLTKYPTMILSAESDFIIHNLVAMMQLAVEYQTE